MDLVSVIKYLYPTAEVLKDFVIANYGDGPVIEFWDDKVLGEKPSDSLLVETWDTVVKIKSLADIKINEFTRLTKEITGKGFTSNALGEDYFYSTLNTNEDRDQLNLTAAVVSSILNEHVDGFVMPIWCTKVSDNTLYYMLHNVSQIRKMAADGKSLVISYQARLDTAIKRLRACVTEEEINSITL